MEVTEMSKGTVSINAENIMPVIKQWLYSDKDIFVREMVSNACDAVKKYRWLVQNGQAEGDEAPDRIDVIVDKEAGTLTFSDNGIIALSPSLDPAAVPVFALDPAQRLRRAPSPRHLPYLAWHREHIFRKP